MQALLLQEGWSAWGLPSFAAWRAGVGMTHTAGAACFESQAVSLGLPPQQSFYFKSGER